MILNNSTVQFKVGSLQSGKDRDLAARLVAKGGIAGIFNRGVCALWFDGGNEKAVEKISQIKGERKNKALALTLSLEEFIPMIDFEKLPDQAKDLLLSTDLKWKVGSLLFIRAPLKKKYHLLVPAAAKVMSEDGICMIQNWDSFGHEYTEWFLKKVKKLGIKYPCVTSMNLSNQPEIVDQKEAQDFCQKRGIQIFLKDPKAHPEHKGSYTIIAVDKNGISLTRDGNIPGRIIERILGVKLNKEKAKKINHPQIKFPDSLLEGFSPEEIRQNILQYLNNV